MKCPKCNQENDPSRVTCFKCGMVLPRMYGEDTSYRSNVDIVIDENVEANEIVSATDCIFLTKLEELKEVIGEEEYSPDILRTELEALRKETGYIKELLGSFSEEEKSWMQQGIYQIEQSYHMFQDSINIFLKFLEDNDSSHIEESIKTAQQASQMLLYGINEAQKELEKEEQEETQKKTDT